MATLSNTKIKDTYQSLVKFNDNGNITTSPKRLTDGFGNASPFYVSTTQIGIGTSPNSSYDLHVYANAKIGANLDVSGNLTVNGTLTYLNVTDLAVEDPLIKLAKDNDANILDIGLFGKYAVSANVKYKGFFNDASDDKFKIFTGLTTEPTTTVDVSDSGYTVGTLVANLEGNVTGNLTGNVTGNLTGNVTGDVTGDLTGDVTGNITGNVTGNLTGSVTGGTISGTTGTFSGIITANSSSSGDYVRLYGSSGTGKWDIYGNGANLRISDNEGAGVLAVDTGATFGGDISIPVAKKIKFGGGNHTYINEDIDDRLRFFTGGAEFMRFTEDTSNTVHLFEKTIIENQLEVDNVATFSGHILTTGLGFSNGEGDIIDSSTFGKSGIGNTFRWIEQNSGSTGSTWKKVCDIELRSGFLDGVQIDIIVYQPSTNWGETASLIKNHYVVAIRGDQSDTGPFYNSALVYGKNANLLRVYKSGTYTYELQARSSDDNKDLIVEYTFTSKNNCKVTPTTSYADGTTSGGTAYTATVDANTIVKFPGNLEFNGAIFDDAEIDDLRVNGILYLGAGADSTYGGYLTNTGATAEGIKAVVDDVDGFTINAVTGNAGEQNTFFKVDDAVKLYDANGVVLETVLGGVKIPDDIKLKLGTGSDLEIYHDGSDSFIQNSTGSLVIEQSSGAIALRPKTGENGVLIVEDGGVSLYYDNVKKFETTSTGATLSDALIGTSAHFTGNVEVGSNADISMDSSANGQLMIDGLGYQGAIALDDTAMYIYHNSSARNLVLGTNETARLTIDGSGNSTFAGTINGSGVELSNYMQIKVDDAEIYFTNTANNDYWRWKRDASNNFICDHYNGSSTTAALTFNSSQNATFASNITTTGAITAGELSAASIGVSGSNGTDGKGISLYGGAASSEPTYGMMFQQTSSFGTFGYVSGDWATYFTMNSSSNRGWIFRNVTTSTNVASINNQGQAHFQTPSKITSNDTSLTIEDAGTNAMLIKVGAGDELYIGSNNTYQFRGTTTGQARVVSAGYFNVTSGASNYAGIEMYQTDGSRVGFLYGDGGAGSTPSIGILDSDGHWAIRAARDTFVEFRVNNIIKLQTTTSINYNYQPTWIEGGSADWNETTPGTATGSLHLDPGSATDNFGSAITFGASDSNSGTTAQSGIYTRSDGAYGTKMYFATSGSYAAGARTQMMIDYTGNVGVNTSNPLSRFVVSEGTNQHGIELAPGTLSYIQAYDRATSTYGNMTIDAKYLAFGLDNGAEKIRFTADGHVGIGTQSPSSYNSRGRNLVLSGSGDVGISIDCSSANSGSIMFADGTGGTAGYRGSIEYDHAADSMEFSTSATPRITITDSGHVGIGTQSPYDSSWSANSKQLTISGTDYGVLNLNNTSGPTRFAIGAGDGKLYLAYDDVAGAHRIIVTSSGNVGIGQNNAASKLQVGGNIRVGDTAGNGRPYIDFVRNGGAVVGGIGWHTDDVFYVGAHPSAGPTAGNSLRVYGFSSELRLGCTNYGDVMFVTEGGNKARVGIGGSPASSAGVHNFLSIRGSSHAGIVLQDTDSGAVHEMWNDGGTLNMWDSSVGYRMRFYTSGDSQIYNGLRVDSIGVSGSNGTDGKGISLYNGASGGEPTYGMMFMQTSNFGTYGSVSGDWATYFTMNNNTARGWIFRRVGVGNFASISAGGDLSLSGQVVFPTTNQRIAGLNGTYLKIQSGSASDGGINFVNTSGTNLGYIYASGGDYGMLNSGGYWTFRHTQGGHTYLYAGNQSYNWRFQSSNGYAYFPSWINLGAGTGLFTDTNGAHFYGNTGGTYGAWRTSGSRNGYSGIYDNHSATNANMFDSNGNGGNFKPGTGWHFYYSPGNDCLGIADSTTSSSYGAYVTGGIYSTADIVAYSDIRAKENIVTVDSAIEKVNKLRGVYYTPKKGEDKSRKVGVIAQEILQVLPEVVTYDNENDQYGVDYGKITGLLIEAIKDQQKQIDKLTKFVDKLNK